MAQGTGNTHAVTLSKNHTLQTPNDEEIQNVDNSWGY
jgi:hypothetical protein